MMKMTMDNIQYFHMPQTQKIKNHNLWKVTADKAQKELINLT